MGLEVNSNNPARYSLSSTAQSGMDSLPSSEMDVLSIDTGSAPPKRTIPRDEISIQHTEAISSGGMDVIATGTMDDLENSDGNLEVTFDTVVTNYLKPEEEEKEEEAPKEEPPASPKIQGQSFKTWGDPHETTGDGLAFDNSKPGKFVKLASSSGDLVLQTRQEVMGKKEDDIFNRAFALRTGSDLVSYEVKDDQIKVNGKVQALKKGETIKLPGGGSLTRNAEGNIDVTSSKGDVFHVTIHGGTGAKFINIVGTLSADRTDGEVKGSLGTFDADTDKSNDRRGRDGKIISSLDAFLEEWRVRPEEDLL